MLHRRYVMRASGEAGEGTLVLSDQARDNVSTKGV